MSNNSKTPEFLKNIKKPWKILAPMVNNSEQAFRDLTKRYGADFCYTEMVHCRIFNQSKANPLNNIWYTTSDTDRPLVIQICGNDPEEMLKTCLKIKKICDAIDINFGCPQEIAKKGFYGSFLMDDLDLIQKIVLKLSKNISVPLFCKIRVFQSAEKTVKFAKMLQDSGCSLLAVNGRLREQRGQNTGYVSLDHIKAVKSSLSIPVISNGGILSYEDIKKTLEITKCDGIMIAESILYDPLIFVPYTKPSLEVFKEYLDIIKNNESKAKNKHIKSHAFKLFHHLNKEFNYLNEKISKCIKLDDFYDFYYQLKHLYDTLEDKNELFKLKPYIRKEYI